jgi:small subunit ribosomal protein S9
MATRLGAARLVLPALNARTLYRRHHIPLRAFVASTPAHIHKPFVPPASLETRDVEEDLDDSEYFPQRARQRPPTSTFYTTRSDYYEVIGGLQDAIHSTRATLKSLHLYPLPKFALDALPPAHPAWADRADMGAELDVTLSAGMYRQLVLSLKELELYHRIAKAAGITELHEYLGELIGSFESTKQVEARERRILKQAMVGKRAKLDAHGRSYTLGRRKTSTARVWMIKVQDKVQDSIVAEDELATTSVSTLLSPSVKVPSPPTTSVLINSAPISEYFPLPADRETVVRPLKLAGLLGAYNVFALVRGGGTSGQSGALALAISRACVSHAPEVEPILRKGTLSTLLGCTVLMLLMLANLMKRDPRMVERKKTGLAKARKAVCSSFTLLHSSVPCGVLTPSPTVRLGQALTCCVVATSYGYSVNSSHTYYTCSYTTASCLVMLMAILSYFRYGNLITPRIFSPSKVGIPSQVLCRVDVRSLYSFPSNPMAGRSLQIARIQSSGHETRCLEFGPPAQGVVTPPVRLGYTHAEE